MNYILMPVQTSILKIYNNREILYWPDIWWYNGKMMVIAVTFKSKVLIF